MNAISNEMRCWLSISLVFQRWYAAVLELGALSPLFTGEAMGVTNYVCMGCAVIAAACFAYAGNYLLKVELKKK